MSTKNDTYWEFAALHAEILTKKVMLLNNEVLKDTGESIQNINDLILELEIEIQKAKFNLIN